MKKLINFLFCITLPALACTTAQLNKAEDAFSTCAAPEVAPLVSDLIPVLTAIVTSQPQNAEQIVNSLESIGEQATICGLEKLATGGSSVAVLDGGSLVAQPRLLIAGGLTPAQRAFAAHLLNERIR